MSKPTITSLVSANGPSVSSISPPRTRTVVAADGSASTLPVTRRPAASLSATQTLMSGTRDSSVSGSVSVQTNIMYFMAFHSLRVGFTRVTNGRPADRTAARKKFATAPVRSAG
jgi:hypothetical protein